MSPAGKSTKRSPYGYHDIAAHIRERIVNGEFAPGARLPTRSVLEQRFTSTSITVQRAFDKLSDEGFIRSEGVRGTFVVEHPPHLSEFALVFDEMPPRNAGWSRFYQAMFRMAKAYEPQPDLRLRLCCINAERRDEPAYRDLVERVEHHGVAGLVFMFTPGPLMGSPVMQIKDVPRVVVSSGNAYPGIPSVYPDVSAFFKESIARLQSLGRSRIAAIGLSGSFKVMTPTLEDCMAEAGLPIRPWWLQSLGGRECVIAARTVTHLLLRGTAEDGRPDGIILADDHLGEAVLQGITDAGLVPGRDLDVVMLANFPLPPDDRLPFLLLGFDAAALVGACVSHVRALRAGGEAPPGMTLIPPRWGDQPPLEWPVSR